MHILEIDKQEVIAWLNRELTFSPLSPAITNHGTHKGWKINHNVFRPISGQFLASRYGVTMNANSIELLRQMINNRK